MWDWIKKQAQKVVRSFKPKPKPAPVKKPVVSKQTKKVVKTIHNIITNKQRPAPYKPYVGSGRLSKPKPKPAPKKPNIWQRAINKAGDLASRKKVRTIENEAYERELAWAEKFLESQVAKKQADIEKQYANLDKQFKAGKLTKSEFYALTKQYNDYVKKQQDIITKQYNIYDKSLKKQASHLQSPLVGKRGQKLIGAVKWLYEGTGTKKVWDYSLGKGDVKTPSAVTAPKRAWITLDNLIQGKRDWKGAPQKVWNDTGEFTPEQRAELAKKKMTLSAPKNENIWDRVKKEWYSSFHQRVVNPKEYSPLGGEVLEAILDPIWMLPTGWGGKVTKAFGKTSTGQSIAKVGSKVKTIWKSDKQPVVKALKWLGASSDDVAKAKSNKVFKKYYDDFEKKFAHLTDDEIRAYQMKMQGIPIKYKNKVRWDKVDDMVDAQKKLYQNYYNIETSLGYSYKGKKFYLPNRKNITSQFGDDFVKEMKTPWFMKHKELDKVVTDRAGMLESGALRGMAHDKLVKSASPRVMWKARKDLKGTGALKDYLMPTRKGLQEATAKIANTPDRLWKKSVLQYRPAWYEYNISHNIPASFMGGGKGTASGYADILKAMWKEKTLNPKLMQNLPDEVVGGLMNTLQSGAKPKTWLGKIDEAVGKFGNAVEDTSRGATFLGAMKGGMNKKDAIKQVNKYLFDYSKTARWEKPLKKVIPFWNWQKNITKFTAKLPFTNPKASKIYSEIRKQFMDKPLEEIPDKEISFTDPDTGKTITYNPRDAYRGKIKIGKKWRSTPFLPVMPEQIGQIGVSPWLKYLAEQFGNKTFYGKTKEGDNPLEDFARLFPQYSVAKDQIDARKDPSSWKESWFTPSGYSKEKQGYDKNAKNYDEKLDKRVTAKNSLGSFLGTGVWKEWDQEGFDTKQKQNAFMKDYLGTDWYKKYPEWDDREKARESLAKKYGYDLDKDVYNGMFAKYDTKFTTDMKERKRKLREASQKFYKKADEGGYQSNESKFWKKYYSYAKGSQARKDLLAKNPQYAKFKSGTYKGKGKSEAGKFWEKYWSADKETRRKLIADNPQYSKKDFKKRPLTAKQKFWKDYYASNPDKRKELIADNPKYSDYKKIDYSKFTASDWAKYWEKRDSDKQKDMAENMKDPKMRSEFTEYKKMIEGSIKTKFKRGTRITWKDAVRT